MSARDAGSPVGVRGQVERDGELRRQEAKNIRTIVDLEEATRARGTGLERLIDRIAWVVARPVVITIHLVFFAVWMFLNRGPGGFDPYPYSLLTLTVSLEAILLSVFLLIAQNRMSALADRRAHLDLQINLLAEQELTAILRTLCTVAERVGVDLSNEPAIEHFRKATDVVELADILDEAIAPKTDAEVRD